MLLLACLMMESVQRQERFRAWPLHLTLVPWFEVRSHNLLNLINSIEEVAKNLPRFKLTADGTDYFDSRVKVTIVKPNESLIKLHQQLLNALNSCDAKLISDKYVGEHFKPHITNRGEKGPPRREIQCRRLYLVGKCENGDRQVVYSVNFQEA